LKESVTTSHGESVPGRYWKKNSVTYKQHLQEIREMQEIQETQGMRQNTSRVLSKNSLPARQADVSEPLKREMSGIDVTNNMEGND
jgi:hypothetical protein